MSENKIKIARHTKREYYPIISYYNDWVILSFLSCKFRIHVVKTINLLQPFENHFTFFITKSDSIYQNLIPAFIMKTFSDLIHHLILYWIVSAIPVYIKVIPEVFNDKKFLFLPYYLYHNSDNICREEIIIHLQSYNPHICNICLVPHLTLL